MKSAIAELNKAIYAVLSNMSFPVYDCIPENTAFPYCDISEMTGSNESAKNLPGESFLLTAHLWSQYKGTKEVREMIDEFVQTITSNSLVLTGFNNNLTEVEFIEVFNDPDGITRHGVVKIRFYVTEA